MKRWIPVWGMLFAWTAVLALVGAAMYITHLPHPHYGPHDQPKGVGQIRMADLNNHFSTTSFPLEVCLHQGGDNAVEQWGRVLGIGDKGSVDVAFGDVGQAHWQSAQELSLQPYSDGQWSVQWLTPPPCLREA